MDKNGAPNMKVSAFIIETTHAKALAERGKYTEEYASEAAILLAHPDDIVEWGFTEGQKISVSNQENTHSLILLLKKSTNVNRGEVNLIDSPWTSRLFRGKKRAVVLDLEPTQENVDPIETVLKK